MIDPQIFNYGVPSALCFFMMYMFNTTLKKLTGAIERQTQMLNDYCNRHYIEKIKR